MKILLASLNSKYIHTNLAIRYLKRYLEPVERCESFIRDFTINQPLDQIVHEIFRLSPDWIGLSVYIWNLEETLKLVRTLKKINPEWRIILGGPEVGYNAKDLMLQEPQIDYVISGEGELPLTKLAEGELPDAIAGLTYRCGDQVISNPPGELMDIDVLLFPYDLPLDTKRLIYYETSRGCPYQCAYCMSATIRGVRNKNLEQVKQELTLFIESGVPIVKFVDRTFNIDQERSFAILKHIMAQDKGRTTFHMELSPRLINAEWTTLLSQAREGLFQFEIGIQSTNPAVITAINRRIYFGDYREELEDFLALDNCHSHVDLIAGLPGEDEASFYRSFDQVYQLGADHFQLGFLKLLKGSPLREDSDKYGYVFSDYPPYEVIASNSMDFGALLRLKVVEELLELYSNSHRFEKSMDYLVPFFDRPSDFFKEFADFWELAGAYAEKHALITLFERLYEFASGIEGVNPDYLKALMKFDYHRKNRYRMTEFFGDATVGVDKQRIHEHLKDPDHIKAEMPQYEGMRVKEILKHIQVVRFNYDILGKTVREREIFVYFDFKYDTFGKIRIGEENE